MPAVSHWIVIDVFVLVGTVRLNGAADGAAGAAPAVEYGGELRDFTLAILLLASDAK
jgi:hypothetical protein